MTLTEKRGNIEIIYHDEDQLMQSEWCKKLGINQGAFVLVVGSRNVIEIEAGPHGHYRLTPVGEFPKIITGLGKRRDRRTGLLSHDWAVTADTNNNFQVMVPSGATFVYEYAHNNLLDRIWRKAVREFLWR